MRAPALTLAACAILMGCSDAVDKAAKRRIFSPEDPPKAVTSASERLPPENVADDSTVARRVLGMGAAEITERVGPHRYSAKVSFDWTGAGRGTRLEETRTLFAGPGGVAGDFHATIENSRDQGLEVMRVRGQVYARSRYGRFRQRLRDRGMAEREREEVQGAVRDFDSLFLGRLKLSAQGSAGHEGRTVWKYVVSLGPPGAGSPPKLPPLIEPKGGQDETTKRRRAFLEQRQPRTLEGEVLVDAETSVVLKAHLVGRLSVEADAGVAELRMVVDCSLTEVGREAALAPPKEFLPDEDKPQGIADALDRFGIPRVRSDAGTGAEEVRPDDE